MINTDDGVFWKHVKDVKHLEQNITQCRVH